MNIKYILLLLGFGLSAKNLTAQATVDLKYYLPANVSYNPAVPVPSAVLGHEVGEWHVTHDKQVEYMYALANANPARVKIQVSGTTYEGRKQVLLIITSPENHAKLATLQQEHLALSDPAKSGSLNTDNMPVVFCLGYTIHGNEPSGCNAALLMAYHLAAATGSAIEQQLKESIVLLDPAFNPDGMQRFSTWVNQHKSATPVTDPNSREFNEVWPGGRFNHYWFDLNRDWLPAVHKESRNRLRYFHDWRPNVLTDHHEMGGNSTFFFQPGVPSRVNPLTPKKNQELTAAIGKFHAKYLDGIGSLYYTKEGFDDYYYGKGSTFPDIHGGVGILFEQGSSRGHAQETANGLLTFPFTIRNQFYTSLSSFEAGIAMRKELLEYQRSFYKEAMAEANASGVKGYVFGDADSRYNTGLLLDLLKRHRIEVQGLDADWAGGALSFKKGESFFVPAAQPQYRLIRSIFEKQLKYEDSLFYDVTTWTIPIAFGVPYAEVTAANLKSLTAKTAVQLPYPAAGNLSATATDYGFVLDWTDFEAPAALYFLQKNEVITRVITQPATVQTVLGTKVLRAGTIMIPTQLQTRASTEIFGLLQQATQKFKVQITGVKSGLAINGIDLGSNNAPTIKKPVVAMLVGNGVSATDAGEVWHLLDQRMQMPVSHLEIAAFNRIDASGYTHLIMVSGSMTGLNKEKLKAWVEQGGVLIACEDAVQWCSSNGISRLQYKKVPAPIKDSSQMLPYAAKPEIDGAQRMNGAIFRAEIDTTHPLCFGYTQPYIDLFKTNSVFLQPSRNPFASPVRYGANPLQSGFITAQNYDALKGTASVVVQTVGSGRVIHMADNPNFRAFWLGGMKLFMNSLFFGKTIAAGSASAGEE
ncbi:MAG: M14 family metallopeptidase [Chitinophagaceae bacterium]|nr:M14 family metallopeptidase [Chitinophagaceae bacterium]